MADYSYLVFVIITFISSGCFSLSHVCIIDHGGQANFLFLNCVSGSNGQMVIEGEMACK